MDRLFNHYCSDVEDYLGHVKNSLGGLGAPIYIAAPENDAGVRIIAEAERKPGTLIAMATHGRSGIPRMVMGSVTNRVLHAAIDLILIVRASSDEDFTGEVDLKTIIVPVDGFPLAEQVLSHSAHLAQPFGLAVTLLRVTPPMGECQGAMAVSKIDVTSGFQFDIDIYEGLIKEPDERTLAYLGGLEKDLYDLGVVSVIKRVVLGQADDTIVDLARQMPGNLVVMTTHGRSGICRWVLGSVADGVVRRPGNPVFVIRWLEKSSAKNKAAHRTDGDQKPMGAGIGSDIR
jgi:nucleotide-binding universal stress UspA family protein